MSTFYNLLSSLLFQGAKIQNENANKTTAIRMSFVSYLSVILLSIFGSMNMQGQTTLISPTGNGGFESAVPTGTPATDFTANGWTVVNNSTTGTDKLFIGTAATPSLGTYSMFSGTSATSFVGQAPASVNHIYRDITFPAGESKITLTFKYKIPATDATFDFLKLWLVPTTTTPVAGTQLTTGQIGVTAGYDSSTTYVTQTVTIPASAAGTTQRLVFSWRSDGFSPSAVISVDEISLVSAIPVAPSAAPITFSATGLSQTGMTVNWIDNSTNETGFRVYRSTDNITFTQQGADILSTSSALTGTAYSLAQTGLTAATNYYYRIVAYVDVESSYLTGSQITPSPVAPNCPTTIFPANAATGVVAIPTLTWSGAGGLPAPTYDVYFSANSALVSSKDTTVRVATAIAAASFTTSALTLGSTYYWMVVPVNSGGGPTTCTVNSFTVLAPATYTATALGGLWNNAATWVGGVVPPDGNDVTIPAGAIVTINQVTSYRNLTIAGTVQWNASTNAMTIANNLTINSGGVFLPYNTGLTGQTVNVGGSFQNDGYANLALSTLVFNGTGATLNGTNPTLSGTGTFQGDGTRGIIKTLTFTNLLANVISTTQDLTVTTGFNHFGGSLNTNGKLKIDNTAQVYGLPLNLQVANIAVTNMGAGYTVAPVVFGQTVVQYGLAVAATLGTRYVYGNNVYLCTTAGTFNATPPTTTAATTFATSGPTLLWIGTVGTLGTNVPYNGTLSLTTNYFYGNNVYQAIATTATTTMPVHTSGLVGNFRYLGTVATATVNYDAITQTVRSLNLTSAGTGYNAAPAIAFSIGAGGTAPTTAAAATAVYIQQIAGPANSVTTKSGGAATISGGLTINSDQGASVASSDPQASSGVGAISTSNGGLNYSIAPLVGFAGPATLNLVTNPGSGYTVQPTITVSGGTLVSGTALTTSNFTITTNLGKVVSVYLNTATTATYSVPPTLTLTAPTSGTTATLAFPTGCWPAATANIGANGQLTSFTITNAGFGYAAAPIVGVGTTSGNAAGGTFTTVATAPTARIALYNLISNLTSPSTTPVVASDDAAIPASRKLNTLSLSTNGKGLNLTGNLTLFGTSPLTLTASGNAPGNVLDLGGNNLLFTWNGFAGSTSTFGATNAYIKNGSMTLTGRGGGTSGSTFNFPFSGTVTVFTGGASSTAVTSGTDILTVKVTESPAPSNTTLGTALAIGSRSFKVNTGTTLNFDGTAGALPIVTLNYNSTDNLTTVQEQTFVAEASNITGAWALRSGAIGTGTLAATGSKATATIAPGPAVLANGNYYSWASATPTITNTLPLTVCANSGTFTITGTDFIGVTAVSIGGTPVTAFTVVSATSITGFAGAGTTGFVSVTKNGTTVTGTETVTVSASPIAPLVSPTSANIVLGGSASFTATGTGGTYNWYSAPTGGTLLFTGSTYAPTGICTTTTYYVSENNGSCDGARAAVTVTVQATVIAATSPTFCGTGGINVLSVTPTDPSISYSWTSLTSGTTLDTTTGTTVNATMAATSDFMVTGTSGACNVSSYYSVGVYALPTATVTTSASGVCPGTAATINSGLTAGNFTVTSIPYLPYTIPTNATTIISAGVTNSAWPQSLPTGGGSLDDGGWTGIPLGFNFNYFGTTFNTISAGTNGLLMFGTVPGFGTGTGQLGQFTFNTTGGVFPNVNNPGNVIALMAGDQTLAGGAIKFWTEGYAPNRKFKLLYEGVPNCCSATNPTFTAYVTLYETLGTVEIHILNKNNTNACTTGLQDSTKTVGAVAPGRQANAATILLPEAWRFSPPSNYTTVWTKTDTSGTSTIASGTNIFSQNVAPLETTVYNISYTNQTTGCANAPGSAQVTMNVLSNTAPSGISALATPTALCYGNQVTLFTDYTGPTAGLSYQWQYSTNGSSWSNIPSANAINYADTMLVPTTYRLQITSCTGTPVYTTPVSVNFINNILTTTPATRCGVGTVDLSATGNTGASIKWFDVPTGGTALFTGGTFTTPSIGVNTTYYVEAKTSGPGCSSPRVPVLATVNPAPAFTLSTTAINLCVENPAPLVPVTITAGASDYNTYVWSSTTGITGTSAGWTINPSVSTTYTLTASQSAGICSAVITLPVSVNVTPVTVTTTADTLCEGGAAILTATSQIIGSGPQTAPTGYLSSNATTPDDEEILNVTFGTINNTSTCTSTGLASSILNQYSDFTNIPPPTFTAGTTVPLSINIGTCGGNFTSFTNVFIDYNRDGVFDSTTERAFSSTIGISGPHLLTGSITIPSTATPGVTRMRVVNIEQGSITSSPSGTYGFGETEDYNINILNIVNIAPSLVYTWAPATGLSATTGINVVASPTATTTYTVTATNPTTGCSNSAQVTVNVNVVPAITGPSELCMPTTITLENAVAHGVWSSSNVDVATVSDTGIVTGVSTGTVIISYAVSFANPVGCVITRTYTVTVHGPPTVVSYTQSQTILTNNNASFNVSATGSGITYQWEVSNGSLPLTFTPITNTGIYSGATTSTLSLTSVGLSYNGYLYHCVISGIGSCTAATTTAAVLNVGDTGIVTHPSNVSLCNTGNGTATYTVLGEGVVQGYAWQVNTGTGFSPISNGTVAGLTYAGATTATLTVSGITVANSGWSYKCIISGPTNNPVSNTATLTVNQQLTFPTTLANQTVCYTGGVANFTIAPLGTATGYQWQYSTNGTTWNTVVNGTPAGVTYTGATSPALVVTTTDLTPVSGLYYYRAQAIAAAPCADAYSNSAQLIINNPTVVTQPLDSITPDGTTVVYTVNAIATNATYQWQTATSFSGPYTNVVNDSPLGITYTGQTTASMSVTVAPNTLATLDNNFRVIVTSNGCSVNSSGALLGVTNYCASAASSSSDEDITNVTIGTLSNASACASLVGSQGTATGTANLYSNFRTAVAPPVLHAIGMTVPISIQVTLCGTSSFSHGVRVYFDFNHNGLLTDAGEEFIVWAFANSNTHTINANIAIPANALMGTTLMRVVCKESSAITPCGASSFGETEDYTVDLQQPLPCAGTPLAGSITASVATLCYSGTSTLTLSGHTNDVTGISIRWEKTTDGANWTVIPGETTAVLSTGTITQETVYRAVVTCANGSASATTDPMTISVDSPTVGTVTDVTRCGTGPASLSAVLVAGDSLNWYTAATGGTAIGTGTPFVTPIISATTIYYVEAKTVTCTSARVAVTATVTTPPALTLSSATATICEGQSTPTITVTAGSSVYDTFDWLPADSVSGDIFSGYTFSPSATTTYTVTSSQFSGLLCNNVATFTVTVNPRPTVVSIAPSPASVCVNTVLPLVATGGTIGSSGTATIGTGTSLTTTTEQPTAFCNRWPSYRSQTIYTAAELTAAGIGAGTISSLAYNISTLGDSATNANFTVMIGATSVSAFTATAFASTANYTTVYGPTTYTHTASGWQTINFTTPYVWDGTSNIIINILQDGADALFNSQTFFTATTDNKTLFTPTASTNTPSFSTKRLNVKLDWTSSVPTTLAWTPTTNLYTNAAGTTPYTGQNVSTVYVNSSTAGQTLYTTTATTTFGCIRIGTVDVTVNPDTTIALGSGSATPTVCINNAITNIVYTLGHETNATVIGLPAGVTGSYTAGVFTISGTPTESGTFTYTVTATGLCLPASLSGTITVNPDTTIALTTGGAIQTLCVNNAITAIVYGVTNGTGVAVTGLPTGVTGSYVAGVYTISGTPTVSGTFDYTVTSTGLCVQQSLSGTITVNPDTTLTWTSGSNAQTLCENNAITNIVYAVGNGTATVTGLPTGVTGNYAAGVFTISGTPTVAGTFNYTVTTSGLCVQTSATGTITVNPTTTLALTSGNTAQTLCVNNAISNIVYAIGNGTGATVTGLPAGVTANYVASVVTISGTPTVSGTFAYTVTPTGLCVIASLSGTISVNASTAITTQPASQVACPRSSVTFATVAQGVSLTYQWYFNGVAIANATSATYTIGFVNPSDAGVYTVAVGGGCSSNVTSNSAFLAVQSVPAPTGTSVQTAVQGALLSSIVASGTNIIWYATLADAQAGINPLSLSYVLPVGTTTFYATQTVNGCQSYATLAVTMSVALGTKGFDLAALVYYPNPVTEMFNISYKLDIESIEVFNIVGQRILEVKPNMLATQVDMSALPSGTYMMLVKADGASKVIKVVKK